MADAPEWMRDMCRVVDDKLMKQISEDFRRPPPPPGPVLPTANPVDAAPIKSGSDTVSHGGSGWVDSPQIRDWKPPGLDHCDRLLDQADAMDRAARIAEMIEAGGLLKKLSDEK